MVAEDDASQKLLGFAIVKPCATADGTELRSGYWAELLFVAVISERRGEGIGRHLVAAAEAAALQNHFLGLVGSIDPAAEPFWVSMAFQVSAVGETIGTPDPSTRAQGALVWWTPADRHYPVWVWKSLDAGQPVRAYTVPPARVRSVPLKEIDEELQCMAGYRNLPGRSILG